MISKEDVIRWIGLQLSRRDGRSANPCKEGLEAALFYLKEPVMPAAPSDEMLALINANRSTPRTVYQAMRTKLMEPPRPKMETVYCVAWMEDGRAYVSHYVEQGAAVELRRTLLGSPYGRYTCISEVYPATVPAN